MSKIKVNEITTRSGSTLTLGESGTTVTLASCASQSGFGRNGTVNWCSTIHTNSPGTVTATSGKGYFLNTTSGAITINLPSSPSVGDIVSIKDYANTFDTNNVTVGRNSSKISGLCLNATLSTEGQVVTLIYADSTKGWMNVQTDSTVQGTSYVTATGGTITTSGDYKIHTFNASGCFQVTDAGTPGGSTKISYLVVAGGGGGGNDGGGGGGAGGFREGKCSTDPYADSPLDSGTAITASVATFPITVGAGGTKGTPAPQVSTIGGTSTFSTISSAGGGRGGQGSQGSPCGAGGAGGSGGGARSNKGAPGGAGNTPPVSPSQGFPGGASNPGTPPFANWSGAGGGGATTAGADFTAATPSGVGGTGATTSITASPVVYAGGGGGGGNNPGNSPNGAPGGPGGGGNGGASPGGAGTNGTANRGGGGGGGSCAQPNGGGTGGSGVVILRYKFQ